MKIFSQPIFVTRPLLPPIPSITRRLEEIWGAQWLTNKGKQHDILELALAKHLKVNQLSLFCNGTIALLAAGKVLEVEGEVITTPFTFAATPHSISWVGADPVFADIDPVTLNLDPEAVESAITPKTSAILAVHVLGVPCDVEGLGKVAQKYGLRLIYDGAHAFGLEINDVGIGSYGDITMYSFHATKLFHTSEGGALACNSQELYEKIERAKNFNIRSEEEVGGIGINGKMNEIQAAVGLAVLDIMDEERHRRSQIAKIYREELSKLEGIILPALSPNVTRSSFQYFAIQVVESDFGLSRNQLNEELKKYNVMSRKYFHPLCSTFDCYKHLPSAQPVNLPIASKVGAQCLALPFYGSLTDEMVYDIIQIIKYIQRH